MLDHLSDFIPDYVKQAPVYHLTVEAVLVIWILWLILFRKSYSPVEKSRLTEKVFTKQNEKIMLAFYLS